MENPLAKRISPFQNDSAYIQFELIQLKLILKFIFEGYMDKRKVAGNEVFQGVDFNRQEFEQFFSLTDEFSRENLLDRIPDEAHLIIKAYKEREALKAARLEAGNLRLRIDLLGDLLIFPAVYKDILIIGLSTELDIRFGKIFAHIQNDFLKTIPTINLALEILYCQQVFSAYPKRVDEDLISFKIKRWGLFTANSPLVYYNLIEVLKEKDMDQASYMLHTYSLPPRISQYLLGEEVPDPSIIDFVQYIKPMFSISKTVFESSVRKRIKVIISGLKDVSNHVIIYVDGPAKSGKKTLAEAISHQLNKGLLIVDVPRMLNTFKEIPRVMSVIFREAILTNAMVYFHRIGILTEVAEYVSLIPLFTDKISGFPGIIFIQGRSSIRVDLADMEEIKRSQLSSERLIISRKVVFSIGLQNPDTEDRERIWRFQTSGVEDMFKLIDFKELSRKYAFNGGTIKKAVSEALNIHALNSDMAQPISLEEMEEACKAQLHHSLSSLTVKMTPQMTWKDLVLPEDTVNTLKDVESYVVLRNKIMYDWGFDKKLSLGKGVSVLFSGPPGTGKTLAAEILAKTLNKDLFRVELSTVVSKYIGETEKNLSRIFDEAQESHAILLFDEADSLFSKRVEVHTSVDRYSNLEINYLLQRIDEYEGVTILTTNTEKSIDEAFKRRLSFRVTFPFPEHELRAKIWKLIIPKEAPKASDIDYQDLGDTFDLAGGNIKNAVLRAAFKAAELGVAIDHKLLIEAGKKECAEMGKVVSL